jgi:hypothetical protein
MTGFSRPRLVALDRVLIFISAAGYLVALATLFSGGFSAHLYAARFSSRSLLRPFVLATASLALAVELSAHRARQLSAVGHAVERRAGWIGACAAAVALVIGIWYGTFAAGGSDSYGYVSEADLWLKGALVVQQPLAKEAPWPDADWAFAPLGYRPGPTSGTIVPTYPPGLPLMMALFVKIAGPMGAYLAVPALGALAVWLTFVLGRKIDNATTGAIAAILLTVSPIFLFQLVAPMSDVPVTAWWLLAVVLALEPATPVASGLAASAALLTRPNLFPLVVVFAAYLAAAGPRPRGRAAMLFLLGAVPGCLAIAAVNAALYGSPLRSGYGTLSGNLSLDGFAANLARYPSWLLESQTPFICLAAAAPWVIRHDVGDATERGRSSSRRGACWFLLATSVALFGCYLLYLPFDSWMYLRFLLPAIPLLLVLSSAVAQDLIRRANWKSRPLLTVGLVGVLVTSYWNTAVSRGALTQKAGQQHFVQTGLFVKKVLPKEAVVLSIMDSGSVRLYSGHMTLRWDTIPPESLDPALAFLRAKGHSPYLAIEPWEELQFRARFAGHSALSALDWPPMAKGEATDGTRIYDLAERDRFLAGEKVDTWSIPPHAGR